VYQYNDTLRINSFTAQAAAFPVSDYNYKEVQTAFRAVRTRWPNADIRVALFNAGYGVWKPFLEIAEDEIDRAVDTNVKAAFAFARENHDMGQGSRLTDLILDAAREAKRLRKP